MKQGQRDEIESGIKFSKVPKLGAEGVFAKANELMPQNSSEVRDGSLEARREKMLAIASDEKAPPDLRSFMLQSHAVSGGAKDVPLDFYQKKDLNTLKQHPEAFPLTANNIQSKIDDPKTPPDLKAALTRVKDDPNMSLLLDTGKQGGGINKADGKISFDDVQGLAKKEDQRSADAARYTTASEALAGTLGNEAALAAGRAALARAQDEAAKKTLQSVFEGAGATPRG
ncbi:MAG: HrpF/NolX family T3SS translocon protein [Pseudomonadota bacterium]